MLLQFPGSAFKIALFGSWMVMVSGPKMVDELRKKQDDELSFVEGAEEVRMTSFERLWPHVSD